MSKIAGNVKRMKDLDEFRELGLLQEINRQILHPLGLALEMVRDADGRTVFGGVWDYRDDPGGIRFEDGLELLDKAEKVKQLASERYDARMEELGYFIQPTFNMVPPDKE